MSFDSVYIKSESCNLNLCFVLVWFDSSCRSRVEEPLYHQDQEEAKKLKPSSVPSANDFGDCIFIDDYEEATLDHPMLMPLEKPYTEADPMVNIINPA